MGCCKYSNKKEVFQNTFYRSKWTEIPYRQRTFQPFKYGGIEIKATCGNTPSATKVPKPLIGESRVDLINSFEWKTHHRETNNLLAVLWDFVDGLPTFVASFYQDGLTEDDWGKIVRPHEGGGRTTSVSLMNTAGVKKMCYNWLAVINDNAYINLLAKEKWIGYKVNE